MESYPGQYPGVTEIRVIKEGNPADADVYRDIVDGIYTKPDTTEPPYMSEKKTDTKHTFMQRLLMYSLA